MTLGTLMAFVAMTYSPAPQHQVDRLVHLSAQPIHFSEAEPTLVWTAPSFSPQHPLSTLHQAVKEASKNIF